VILRPLSATSTILISRVHLAVHNPFTEHLLQRPVIRSSRVARKNVPGAR